MASSSFTVPYQKRPWWRWKNDALAGPHAMTVTYRRNQALVQEIAKRKYLARRFEFGNTIVVRMEDVNAQLAISGAA